MSEVIHPEAYVKDGIIRDINKDIELPSYEGLCLADLAGRYAIMHTTLTSGDRHWELVHWGSSLSKTEIDRYLATRNR